jgi:hypothetical protein
MRGNARLLGGHRDLRIGDCRSARVADTARDRASQYLRSGKTNACASQHQERRNKMKTPEQARTTMGKSHTQISLNAGFLVHMSRFSLFN